MKLSSRQEKIIEIVKENQPISADRIAEALNLSKPTLRSDLAVLTMTGILDARPKVGYFYLGKTSDTFLYTEVFDKKVKEIMVEPVFIKPDDYISSAMSELFLSDAGSLYVLDDNQQLLGLVSRKDLLRATLNVTGEKSLPIAMLMTRMPNIVTTTPNETVLNAGKLLTTHRIDSLPVLSEDGEKRVLGKLSKTALLGYLVEEGFKLSKK